MQSQLVESYMGVVISIPEHRLYMHTAIPSEPVLVEASARLMHLFNIDVLKFLRKALGDGLLAKGERGEIVTRALMVRAHDKVAATLPPINGVKYWRPVPLMSFLKHLLSDGAYRRRLIRSSRPLLPAASRMSSPTHGSIYPISLKAATSKSFD